MALTLDGILTEIGIKKRKSEFFTYTGTPIETIPTGLPKQVPSLCPECSQVIAATHFEENGRVMIEKTCPEHGYFKDIYWSDVNLYLKAEKWFLNEGKGLQNPHKTDAAHCPNECGLCNMHVSHTGLGNVDLTNRCNLRCPICFANANVKGYVYEPSFEEIVGMLENYRKELPVAGRMVQFSGGEPTMHPRFLDIVRTANEMGFSHVQIASNGVKLSHYDFAMRCKEAGLHTIYLQFDGLDPQTYKITRGSSKLLDVKLRAIDNIRKAGMKIVFVPTIINTINDQQVGPILQFAIDNIDVTSGLSYQPVAFTGRIAQDERMQKRFTLPDLARCIEEQTGLLQAQRDWYPLSCVTPFSKLTSAIRGEETVMLSCHPHCSLGTYLFVDQHKNSTPVTVFMDIDNMLKDMDALGNNRFSSRVKSFTKAKAFLTLQKHFNPKTAPADLSFMKFLRTLDGLMDKEAGRDEGEKHTYKTLLVAGMHFQDVYNYDVNRVKRCVIHYSAPNGQLYPFCTYNAGPTFRDKVEKEHSIPMKEYREQNRQKD